MLRLLIGLVLVSSLVVIGTDLLAQDAPPAAENPALAILDRAIAYQGPAEFAQPGAIKDLTVRIACDLWNYNHEPPQVVSLGVRRYLTLDPERFRSEWKTSADTQVFCWDGRRYWYQDGEGSRWLMGSAHADSVEQIKEEITETKYLLRLFFLANTKGPRITFTLKGKQKLTQWGRTHECHVISRDNLDPESTEPPLSLWIDTEDHSLRRATAHASTYGQKSLSFLFRYDERVQPRLRGVLFPMKIEVREQPFGAPRDRRSLIATLEETGGIEFNSSLKPETFKRPR